MKYQLLGAGPLAHKAQSNKCPVSTCRTLSLWVLKPGITSTCHSRSQGSWHSESCFMSIYHVHPNRRTLHPAVGDSVLDSFHWLPYVISQRGLCFPEVLGMSSRAAHSRQACLHQAVGSTNNFISQIKYRHDIKLKNVF